MDMQTYHLPCRNHNAIYHCTELAKCCYFLEKKICRIENLLWLFAKYETSGLSANKHHRMRSGDNFGPLIGLELTTVVYLLSNYVTKYM